MNRIAVLVTVLLVAAAGVAAFIQTQNRPEHVYQSEVSLEHPLHIEVNRSVTVRSSNCMRGVYSYPYTTVRDGDVWLCCVPTEELLSDSFECATNIFSTLETVYGSVFANDLKVQYCALVDPVSEEPHYIPVCIPAPLTAPETDNSN